MLFSFAIFSSASGGDLPVQYKSKLPFHHLGSEDWGVELERYFFGSRHGKSERDAAGGVIKRLIEDDILTGAIIQNANDMYLHCTEHFTLPEELNEGCCHTKRSFRLIQSGDIDVDVLLTCLFRCQGSIKQPLIPPLRWID